MKKEALRYDIKKALENYMPNLIKLLGDKNLPWKKINYGLQQHLDNIRKDLISDSKETIRKDATFYSFIVGKSIGKIESEPMFDFYNYTFKQLLNRLSDAELQPLHKMIQNVLTNFDYKYLNFIGELATLNAYKSTGKYILLNIEEKVYSQNNKKADLFLKRVEDEFEFLVEIVNIHLENRFFKNNSHIEYHLNSKIREKINKTVFDSPKREIFIQPVIWVDNLEQIAIISKLYKNKKMQIDNVFIPMCYLTYKLHDGGYEHRFEYVNTILYDETKRMKLIKRIFCRIFQEKSKINKARIYNRCI